MVLQGTSLAAAGIQALPLLCSMPLTARETHLNTTKGLEICPCRSMEHADSIVKHSQAMEKYQLVAHLNIPYRDLRILDPLAPIPYPTTIFIREKALVVNLESIRMIICQDQASLQIEFYASGHDDQGLPYELHALEVPLATTVRLFESDALQLEKLLLPSLERLSARVSKRELLSIQSSKATLNRLVERVRRAKEASAGLPYSENKGAGVDLYVLESILDDDKDMQDCYLGRRAALAAATEAAGKDAEPSEGTAGGLTSARPTVDLPEGQPAAAGGGDIGASEPGSSLAGDLLSAVREAQEAALEPDSHAEARQAAEQQAGVDTLSDLPQSRRGTADIQSGRVTDDVGRRLPPRRASSLRGGVKLLRQLTLTRGDADAIAAGAPGLLALLNDEGQVTGVTAAVNVVDPHNIEGCEDLLESYFMQVDTVLSRLIALKERIEGTEALIEIDLDHRRNELVAFDLVMTMVTVAFALVSAMSGLMGMNLYFAVTTFPLWSWWIATGISLTAGILLLSAFVYHARKRRLLFIPTPPVVPGAAQPDPVMGQNVAMVH
eukprot:jgi/Astpho2/3934/fgenesh1_pg.00063_%23_10_t